MGVCTFAYPELRLSHCLPTRISNAASPRQDSNIQHQYAAIRTEFGHYTSSGRLTLPYLPVGSNVRDLSSEDNVRKRLSFNNRIPLPHRASWTLQR